MYSQAPIRGGMMTNAVAGGNFSLYVESLRQFGAMSDENEVNVRVLSYLLCDMLEARRFQEEGARRVLWLDVGSGDLGKVVEVLATVRSQRRHIRVECVEPCPGWKGTGTPTAGLTLHNDVWPYVVAQLKHARYDLVSFIHSLYQFELASDGTIPELGLADKVLRRGGSVVIMHEAENSALLKAKRVVYEMLGGSLVDHACIKNSAIKFGWPKPTVFASVQEFRIPLAWIDALIEAAVSGDCDKRKFPWFPWFIFESATSTSEMVDNKIIARTGHELRRQMVQRQEGTFLRVDDVIYVYSFE